MCWTLWVCSSIALVTFSIAMADADGQDAAEEIQEFLAVGVIDILILGMIDDQRLVIVSRDAAKIDISSACR